ncbi:MAG: response regulator [Desulfobacterales bacterium]|nr:response regulator [Desulfobacterales bacterium]
MKIIKNTMDNRDKSLIKKTILVIDDIQANLETTNAILGRDYNVITTNNGIDGLQLSQSIIPDLILLDIMMPDMDGYEVCEKLKINSNTKNIPVIFISSLDLEEENTKIKKLKCGTVDFIHKPFEISTLRNTIIRTLNRKNQLN